MSAPERLDRDLLRNMPLPELGRRTDKEERGRVLTVAGGAQTPGAAALTGEAVLRAGAGKLQMAATEAFALSLAFAVPEALVFPVAGPGEFAVEAADQIAPRIEAADAVVVGPGLMEKATAGPLAERLMAAPGQATFLVDAYALTGLELKTTRAADLGGRLVITPHAGEMAALTGRDKDAVEVDPLPIAREVAARLKAVVVMKGADTHVVSPDGQAFLHWGGAVGLATGGSGDVLAGIIAGLAARGAAPMTAALWGVFVHGQAGARLSERIGPIGFLARELLPEIPWVLAEA